MIERVIRANDGMHKWIAEFKNGRRTRFGAVGYTDYTQGATHHRREMYRSRHRKDLQTYDPYRAGYLSFWLLWGPSRDMETNIRNYNARFF